MSDCAHGKIERSLGDVGQCLGCMRRVIWLEVEAYTTLRMHFRSGCAAVLVHEDRGQRVGDLLVLGESRGSQSLVSVLAVERNVSGLRPLFVALAVGES